VHSSGYWNRGGRGGVEYGYLTRGVLGHRLWSSFRHASLILLLGFIPATTLLSYPQGNIGNYANKIPNKNSCSWWCLHHFKSLPAPPPSAGGEFDLALRRVLRQTAITPSQFDENSSFENMVTRSPCRISY